MRAEEFSRLTKLDRFKLSKFFSKVVHPLKEIYLKLHKYHQITNAPAGRARMQERWDLLSDIAKKCIAYAGVSAPADDDSMKVYTVKRLRDQAGKRAMLEQDRAYQLRQRLAYTPAKGVNIGIFSQDQKIRYERLNKPGQLAIKGRQLLKHAKQEYGIKPTGDARVDYYAMKKCLKLLRNKYAHNFRVIYMNEEQRERYRLDIKSKPPPGMVRGTFLSGAFDTKRKYFLYALDMNRVFFAAHQYTETKQGQGILHHSSFLAGGTALCAGTIKAKKGRILEITNNSGHYSPKLEHFVEACSVILQSGYDPKDDGYALYMDFAKTRLYPKSENAILRVPLRYFVEMEGRPLLYEDFLCRYRSAGDDVYYEYVSTYMAAQRGCTFDYY